MTPENLTTIREIESLMQTRGKIPAFQVRAWLGNPCVEVLGAVSIHIMHNTQRIEPPLSMAEVCRTVQEYYRQCLIQNLKDSQYAPNRSVAGLELVGWFQSLWSDSAVPREYLMQLKMMLRDLCIEDKVPHDQMVGAVLEHLFETPQIAEFFADWKSDPRLKTIFDRAMEWAIDHRQPNQTQA
jgi:hypothetical protein